MKIVIMGPQGSGKSTQAKLLAEKLEIPFISTGDIFRGLKEDSSPLGRRVMLALKRGLLVSDSDTMLVVEKELSKKKYAGGFVIDGFPRNIFQAKNSPFIPTVVFYLDVPDKIVVKRLLNRGREDDTPELIAKRLSEYHSRTEPVLAFYKNQGILVTIPGEGSVESVHQSILDKVRDLGVVNNG